MINVELIAYIQCKKKKKKSKPLKNRYRCSHFFIMNVPRLVLSHIGFDDIWYSGIRMRKLTGYFLCM